MSLYYVRHGQTDWNVECQLQGKSDIPLNATGFSQAEQTRDLLKGMKIDCIYCSPLTRAKQTAEIINQVTQCEIKIEPRLEERGFGDLEGFDLRKKKIDLWSFEQSLCPGAEGMQEFFDRVQSFLKDIQEDIKDKNYLLVAHGGVYLPVHEFFKGMDRNSDLMKLVPENCTVTTFE